MEVCWVYGSLAQDSCFSVSVEDVQGDLVFFDPETSAEEGAWARAIYLGQLPFITLVHLTFQDLWSQTKLRRAQVSYR